MTHRFSASRSFLVVLLLGWTTIISAQQSLNYGFVSPNTKTDLKLEQAIVGMSSPEETKLLRQAINLGCVVRTRIRAFRALGAWSDGAEHSVLLRVKGDEATLRYVISRMGRDAQQKYVIYFHPKVAGPVDLYTLRPRTRMGSLVALSNKLERAGIPFRTMVPTGRTTAVYIIDLDRNLRQKIMAAARSLRARVNSEPGDAQLFGDDDRDKAKAKFDQEIKNYEAANPNLPPTCDAQKVKQR
ncbi:MAG TPA: hypothetical protein VF088_06765 [Pyrinomonadaceae bacterium]